MSITVANRKTDLVDIFKRLESQGISAYDACDNEMAKSHAKHLVGGRKSVPHERLYRFSFPERPGALGYFLSSLDPNWNSTSY